MQTAVLWFLTATVLFAVAAAWLRQAQALRGALEREQQLRRQLVHASGFALAGQLAAATLQEVGSALGNILVKTGTAQALAQQANGSGMPLPAILSELRAQAQLTRDGVRRLLAVVEPADEGRGPFDLQDMLSDAVRVLQAEARRRAMEVVLQPGHTHLLVTGARVQLQLVLMQLLANALDAMEHMPTAHRRVLLSAHAGSGCVEVQVSDRGHGFGGRRPETMFSPYYTTKEGRMGLGLSVARSIVEAHGGHIDARRRAGGGAVFTVSLPARAAPAHSAPAAAAARPSNFAPTCVVQP
ncbi:MAG: sensor histidine kinase [Ramlibacter sp.]